MQKTIFSLCLLGLCTLISCNNNNIQPLCTTFESHLVWTPENFKTDYTIQFPSTYIGNGDDGSPSYYFNKHRNDNNVSFFWTHCSVASCQEYGFVPLDVTFPDTISVASAEIFNTGGLLVRNDLTQLKLFCDSTEIKAAFYYNTLADADGALFLKQDDDQYYAAVLMHYDSTEQQEVEDILKTIQPGSVAPPGND